MHELDESKTSVCFTSEIICSKLSSFSVHVSGVNASRSDPAAPLSPQVPGYAALHLPSRGGGRCEGGDGFPAAGESHRRPTQHLFSLTRNISDWIYITTIAEIGRLRLVSCSHLLKKR